MRRPSYPDSSGLNSPGVVGELQDPGTYGRLFADCDHLFLLNAVAPTELQEGLAAVNEARRAGVKRIVYLSVHDVEKGPAIPHFAAKIAIEAALKDSGIACTILRPNNFYQNDYWLKEAILGLGVYPQPIGDIGLSRVDAGDIAQAAVSALTQPGHEHKTYALVGSDPLSGEDCARAYSEALGREIRYAGNDLDAWAEQALQMLPAWMVYDFKLMYAMFQAKGLVATAAQLKETETVLGRPPRRFSDFVRETVQEWR